MKLSPTSQALSLQDSMVLGEEYLRLAKAIGEMWQKQRPRLHCLVNQVVLAWVCDFAASLGARLSVSSEIKEINEIANSISGLLVNLGTPIGDYANACVISAEVASSRKIIWGLDPVMVERSEHRRILANRLINLNPSFIRCNGDEMQALKAYGSLKDYKNYLCLGGAVDRLIRYEKEVAKIDLIYPLSDKQSVMLDYVVGLGCGQGMWLLLVMMSGRTLGYEDDYLLKFGQAIYRFAAYRAALQARNPAEIKPHLVNELYQITR